LYLGAFASGFLSGRGRTSMPVDNAKSGVSYDVVIVGGGIVGTTLACALAEEQLRVAILEHNLPPPAPSGDYTLRVSAIAPSSRTIFERIGVWSDMQLQRICPVEEMHIWDAGGSGAIHFDSADLGEPCLAYIIENDAMLAALWQRMAQCQHTKSYCPTELDSIEVHDSHVTVRLAAGGHLSARLLVGADGPRSTVRTCMGISSTRWDYAQQGIVAMVVVEEPRRHVAWQRFLPTGPLAFLPLPDGRYSIVWSVDATQAEDLLAQDDATFLGSLQAAFGGRLGRMRSSSARLAFPLQRAHAQRYVAPRMALIGDAAHTVHPLAGQGVNLGLLDAAVLAEVVLDAHRAGRDIGSLSTVRRYERWRKGDNLAMLILTDGLKRLFGSSTSTLVQLRNTGLNLTNALTPLKLTLMRHAAGLAGDLPRLARPQPSALPHA
jgi:2-octaprenylphenol hydroxylase